VLEEASVFFLAVGVAFVDKKMADRIQVWQLDSMQYGLLRCVYGLVLEQVWLAATKRLLCLVCACFQRNQSLKYYFSVCNFY